MPCKIIDFVRLFTCSSPWRPYGSVGEQFFDMEKNPASPSGSCLTLVFLDPRIHKEPQGCNKQKGQHPWRPTMFHSFYLHQGLYFEMTWKQLQYNPWKNPSNTQPDHAEMLQVIHQVYNQINQLLKLTTRFVTCFKKIQCIGLATKGYSRNMSFVCFHIHVFIILNYIWLIKMSLKFRAHAWLFLGPPRRYNHFVKHTGLAMTEMVT